MRQLIEVQLDKPVPKGLGEHLPAAVLTRRILRAEQAKARTRRHGRLRLRNVQLPVVIQDAVERLQHVCGGQVQLVQYDPGALEPAALWNRNYFIPVPVPTLEKLWFQFRLLKSYGSCSDF